jgi:type II secretory ATPase GspE/PulE/Tfp pilus assembly ATPase PilB-like protein
MYAKARENGYLTMKEDGILKLLDGLTTIDEIRRVV